MKHRKSTVIISSLVVLCLFASCRKEEREIDRESGERLFELSERLIKTHADSLELAPDTTTLLRMEKSLTDKMAKVNFQFPPNTDLTLTEEENDSLAQMMKKFREKYDVRLKEMIRRLPADTVIPPTSTAIPRSVGQDPHPATPAVGVDSISTVTGD